MAQVGVGGRKEGTQRNRDEVNFNTDPPNPELPNQVRKNVYSGNKNVGGQDYAMGQTVPAGILGSSGQDAAYFDALKADAVRRAKASIPADTSAYMDALEARGLGRSSIAAEGISGIRANANTLAQQGVLNVQGLQYQARQARINAYLNYLYQSKLQKQSQDQGMFGSLFSIGKVLPFILASNPATAAAAPVVGAMTQAQAGWGQQPFDPRLPDDTYAGGY